jgi:hypothetical protein
LKGQFGDADPGLNEFVRLVRRISGANQMGDPVLLEDLNVGLNGDVIRLLSDEKSHILKLDLGWRRTNDFSSHGEKRRSCCNSCKNFGSLGSCSGFDLCIKNRRRIITAVAKKQLVPLTRLVDPPGRAKSDQELVLTQNLDWQCEKAASYFHMLTMATS